MEGLQHKRLDEWYVFLKEGKKRESRVWGHEPGWGHHNRRKRG